MVRSHPFDCALITHRSINLTGLGPSDSFSDKGSQKHEALDTVNDLTGLTLRQCRAVQECWRDFTIGSVNRLGVQFLVRFFLAFPDYRNFYGALRSDRYV